MQLVLEELNAEAVKAHSEHEVLLGQAARDVASLCQTIYETFPGLEQSVPGYGDNALGPCSLRPAEMLELQVKVFCYSLHCQHVADRRYLMPAPRS